MNREQAMELLIYTVTSAAGLRDEPRIYGPRRLLEVAERLIRYMEAEAGEDTCLQEILSVIESGKQKSSSDEDGFYEMLDLAVEKLVDCL